VGEARKVAPEGMPEKKRKVKREGLRNMMTKGL
jgi:hypothetical protein